MRFISPSFLAFALLMSVFPWVEVRCTQRGAPVGFGDYPVWHQNGWQAIVGDSTGGIPDERGFVPNNPNDPGGGRRPVPPPNGQKPPLDAAPLAGVFLGCVVAGTILGFALPTRKPRLILMGLLCCTALGALLTQTILGFPLKKKGHDDIMAFLQTLPPNQVRGDARNWYFTSGYTVWLYISLVAAFGAVIGVLADALVPPRKRRPWEEEDEDEEEDFDRRRRPRRRRRYEDEDEDEPEPPPRRNPWPPRRDDYSS